MSLYQNLEDEVIADIARRVKKTGRYTETAELMAKSMREQGYSPAKIQSEVMKYLRADKDFQMAVAENTKTYKEEVREIIKQTVKDAKKAGDELVGEAGDMAWNADLSMWAEQGVDLKKPNSMSQLKEAFTAQTVNELRNLTRSTGFKNVNTGVVGILNAYQKELDLALLKVATGVFSYDQVVQDCVHRLAQSGLRSIDYESGRTYQLDTAVRNAVRTGCSQLAGKIMEENLQSSGQDLVITSQHMGSRPEHAPWQNKVFSYSGKNRKYPDFFKETGYGTVTGLKGPNCCHDFYPFWEGASVIPEDIKEPDPVMINGKEYTYYQCTQKQRAMERDIRALKREINATEALSMDSAELRSKLKMKMSEYRKFSDSANLKPKNNRLRVQKDHLPVKKDESIKEYKKEKQKYQKALTKMEKLEKEVDDLLDSYMEALDTPNEKKLEILHGKKYDELEGFKDFVKDLKTQLSGKEAKAVRKIEKDISILTGIPLDKVKMDGMPYDSAELVYKSYKTVLRKYPELKDNLESFLYDTSEQGNKYASCNALTGRIRAFSIFGNYDKLVKQYAHDVKKQFHPVGTNHTSSIVHELGHALDGYMTKKGLLDGKVTGYGTTRSSVRVQREVLDELGWYQKMTEIKDDMRAKGAKHSEVMDAITEGRKAFIKENVSQYAAKNEKEFFAECFVEYLMSDNPREAASVFGRIIDEALGR